MTPACEGVPGDVTKADASKRIDALESRIGRGGAAAQPPADRVGQGGMLGR
jgi:hypothetical protein